MMKMEKVRASGRATCKLCGLKIRKGLLCIKASNYMNSGYCHVRCDKNDIALARVGGILK